MLQQTEQDFEVLVVDDGSTDDTSECARSFAGDPRLRVISQPNRGPSAARNAGLAAAQGFYVSMLDADDLWLPEYLEVMGGALDANPDAPFAYTDAWVFDDGTGRIRRTPAMFYQRPPSTVHGSPPGQGRIPRGSLLSTRLACSSRQLAARSFSRASKRVRLSFR